jgi:hypothetical protein
MTRQYASNQCAIWLGVWSTKTPWECADLPSISPVDIELITLFQAQTLRERRRELGVEALWEHGNVLLDRDCGMLWCHPEHYPNRNPTILRVAALPFFVGVIFEL